MSGKITQKDIQRSYELVALLEVCMGAANDIKDDVPPQKIQLAGALPTVLEQAIEKWTEVHHALEGVQMAQENAEKSQEVQS